MTSFRVVSLIAIVPDSEWRMPTLIVSPAWANALPATPANKPAATSPAPLVLLAEDNDANVRMVRDYLEARGYRVAVAGDERPHSVPPGTHGGNIDINLLVEGTTLFLPVQVDQFLVIVDVALQHRVQPTLNIRSLQMHDRHVVSLTDTINTCNALKVSLNAHHR